MAWLERANKRPHEVGKSEQKKSMTGSGDEEVGRWGEDEVNEVR